MKKFLSIILAIIMLLSLSLPAVADYKKDSTDDDGNVYYIVEGTAVADLFDFRLKDIPNILAWVFDTRTFTVIKKYEDYLTGETKYKCYFNTPNLQMLARNLIISDINDGFTDHTYDATENNWIVDVGELASKENAITRYGFNLPIYTYTGEYPKEYMSVQNILPTTFWQTVWRMIKTLLGLSFIQPPDATNYQTISYFNHEYTDKEEKLISFIRDNFYLNFYQRIEDAYFTSSHVKYDASSSWYLDKGAYDFNDLYMTQDRVDSAKKVFDQASVVLTPEDLAIFTIAPLGISVEVVGSPDENNRYFGESGYQTLKNIEAFIETYSNKRYTFSQSYKYIPEFKALFEIEFYKQYHRLPVFSEKFLEYGIVDDDGYDDVAAFQDSDIIIDAPEHKEYDDKIAYQLYLYNHSSNWPDCPVMFTLDTEFEPEGGQKLIAAGDAYYDAVWRWERFQELFNAGTASNKTVLHYNQCLIKNEGEENECWTTAHSEQKATIAIGNLWASSGLSTKIDYSKYSSSNSRLSREDAVQVLQLIQSFCGPYYTEVLQNVIVLMIETAQANNASLIYSNREDYRVMPFDLETMTDEDQQHYSTSDPRVELYKNSIVGGLVSSLNPRANLNISSAIAKFFIKVAGKITELSIMFQHFINFDFFDDIGLSPATMWTNGFVTIIIIALVILFIFKIVKEFIAYTLSGNSSLVKVSLMLLAFFLELGFLTMLLTNPEQVWTKTKTALSSVMNVGETVMIDNEDYHYLFGDKEDRDASVAYYLPYLDMWSTYNTGYGLADKQQLITNASKMPETEGYLNKIENQSTINGHVIQHWSILLLDSIEYHGKSLSLHATQTEDGKLINGPTINHNAYRVVDHFLAPRVSITDNGDSISMSVTRNENYNGAFQSGFFNLISKLMNVVLLLFLSIIKVLLFIYLWYQLYILIFVVLLSKLAENKSTGQILIDTFSPVLYIIILGLYSAFCIQASMITTGIVAILLQLMLYIATAAILIWWSRQKGFPKILIPIVAIFTAKRSFNKFNEHITTYNASQKMKQQGIEIEDDELSDSDKHREKLFNEDGTVKSEYINDDKKKILYGDWIKRTKLRADRGEQISEKDQRALREYAHVTGEEYDVTTFTKITKKKSKDGDEIQNEEHSSDNKSKEDTN